MGRNDEDIEANMLEDHMNNRDSASSAALVLANSGLSEAKVADILSMVNSLEEKKEEWSKLASTEFGDPLDKKTGELAKKSRLKIKHERGEAANYLDHRRSEVQKEMEAFKKEDTAYLRLKQYYEKEAKAAEAELEEIEKARERHEIAVMDELETVRLEQLGAVCDNPSLYPVRTMTEEAFNNMYEGFKLSKEKADREQEIAAQKQEVFELRAAQLKPFNGFTQFELTLDTTEEEWKNAFEAAVTNQAEAQAAEAKLAQKKELFSSRNIHISAYNLLEYPKKGSLTEDTSEEEWEEMLQNAQQAKADWDSKAEEREKALAEANKKLEEEAAATKAREEQKKKDDLIAAIKEKFFKHGMKYDGKTFSFADVTVEEQSIASMDEATFKDIIAQVKEAKAKADADATLALVALAKEQGIFPVNASQTTVSSWVASFKSPDINVETLSEQDAKLVTDILTRFEGFKDWATKLANKK